MRSLQKNHNQHQHFGERSHISNIVMIFIWFLFITPAFSYAQTNQSESEPATEQISHAIEEIEPQEKAHESEKAPDRNWVDVLSALLTPTIAIFGIYIALQQWLTNRKRLKLELFERRYEVFEKIKQFIANILTSGRVEEGADIQFLRDTKAALFLFDEKIVELTTEMYKKAIRLHALEATERTAGDNLEANLNKQDEIKQWYKDQLKDIDKSFKKYLRLKH